MTMLIPITKATARPRRAINNTKSGKLLKDWPLPTFKLMTDKMVRPVPRVNSDLALFKSCDRIEGGNIVLFPNTWLWAGLVTTII